MTHAARDGAPTVLVIDDDRVDRLMVREMVGGQFGVIEAKSGEEAERLLNAGAYDCVLLDYNIPGTDAWELLAECVERGLPVVMFTGEGNEDVAVAAMKRGAQDYLKKSNLSSDTLLRTVANSIQNVALKRQLAEKQHELFVANAALQEKVEELQCLNADLEKFVHIAAHDFREPLKTMYNYCDLLQRSVGNGLADDGRSYLSAIRSSVKRLAGLIDDLRAFTKLGHGNIEKELCDLGPLLAEVLSDFEPRFRERAVHVKQDALPALPVYRVLVGELYRNLIDNALKHSAGGDLELYFSAERVDHEWVLGVRNTGSDIPDSDLERVFSPFVRLASRESDEGSGIGLTLCRKIIDRHGGRIWIEKPAAQALHFRFTLGNGTNDPVT